jgi:hypothetical protein
MGKGDKNERVKNGETRREGEATTLLKFIDRFP